MARSLCSRCWSWHKRQGQQHNYPNLPQLKGLGLVTLGHLLSASATALSLPTGVESFPSTQTLLKNHGTEPVNKLQAFPGHIAPAHSGTNMLGKTYNQDGVWQQPDIDEHTLRIP